jgi:hypothetical protein
MVQRFSGDALDFRICMVAGKLRSSIHLFGRLQFRTLFSGLRCRCRRPASQLLPPPSLRFHTPQSRSLPRLRTSRQPHRIPIRRRGKPIPLPATAPPRQDRLSPRRGAVMAYTCNLLLRSLHAINIENKIPADAPQEMIFDLPRPLRQGFERTPPAPVPGAGAQPA